VCLLLGGGITSAATKTTPFTISGWIPYWKKTNGASSTISNIQYLSSISPFSYEVSSSGKIVDKIKIGEEPWTSLLAEAKKRGVTVYPTISWFDGEAIHTTLSDKTKRAAHIAALVDLVSTSTASFDGIDIDYENKKAETRVHFSTFLKELSFKLKAKNKKLICTIESRTPLDSRFSPEKLTKEFIKKIEYANDFPSLNLYCDSVRLMTYDQGRADLKLNKVMGTSTLYSPVADIRWVEKVLKLALMDIKASKVILGIPTYGYKYEVVPKDDGGFRYERLRAMNYEELFSLYKTTGVVPVRSSSGELEIVFNATGTPSYAGVIATTTNAETGLLTSKDAPLHYITVPDPQSILDKITLAKKYKLGGVVIFKFDGGTQDTMWDVFRIHKK